VIEGPLRERGHRAVDEALPERGQAVPDAGRGLGAGAPGDQYVREQATMASVKPCR
jgi:hypothetical protein